MIAFHQNWSGIEKSPDYLLSAKEAGCARLYCVLLLLWMLLYNVWVCIASVAGLVLTILSTFIGRGKGGHAPGLICKTSPREVLVTVFNALV